MSPSISGEQAKSFSCPICKTKFVTEVIRNFHVNLKHKNANSSTGQRNPVDHSSHSEPVGLEGNPNNRTVNSPANLSARQTTHTEQEKLYQCPICQKRLDSGRNLRRHHDRVHGEKKFVCEECGKGFGIRKSLTNHLVSHRDKNFVCCDQCGKGFKGERALKSHILNCHSERKFKCDECGADFGQESLLKVHLQTHTGKHFECHLCGTKFNRRHQLKRHITSHSKFQQKASKPSLLVKRESKDGNGSRSANNSFKVEGQMPSLKTRVKNWHDVFGHQKSGGGYDLSDSRDTDGQTSESDEESYREGKAVGSDRGIRKEQHNGDRIAGVEMTSTTTAKQMPNKATFDHLNMRSQFRIPKITNRQSVNDRDTAAAGSENCVQSSRFVLRSGQDAEPSPPPSPPASRFVTPPNLQLVFDVDYKAPE